MGIRGELEDRGPGTFLWACLPSPIPTAWQGQGGWSSVGETGLLVAWQPSSLANGYPLRELGHLTDYMEQWLIRSWGLFFWQEVFPYKQLRILHPQLGTFSILLQRQEGLEPPRLGKYPNHAPPPHLPHLDAQTE